MGEAKRRKMLDPNYGKAINKNVATNAISDVIEPFFEMAEEGFKLFPMSLITNYFRFTDSLPEYPCERFIYEGYPQGIIDYAEKLDHETKCDFWGFLLYVGILSNEHSRHLKYLVKSYPLDYASALIYFWKRLAIASLMSYLWNEIKEETGQDKIKCISPDGRSFIRSFRDTRKIIVFNRCHKIQSA